MIIDNETKKDKSLSQLQFSSLPAFFRNGCFLKWLYPTTMGFPTKNDHFGVFWGYHHLRKHPNISLSRWEHRPTGQVSRAFQDFQDFQVQRWRLASGFMWWKTRWKLRGFPPGYYPWWPPPGRLGARRLCTLNHLSHLQQINGCRLESWLLVKCPAVWKVQWEKSTGGYPPRQEAWQKGGVEYGNLPELGLAKYSKIDSVQCFRALSKLLISEAYRPWLDPVYQSGFFQCQNLYFSVQFVYTVWETPTECRSVSPPAAPVNLLKCPGMVGWWCHVTCSP